jgi:hypothetical protein
LVRFWYQVSPDLPIVALGRVWATFLLQLSTSTDAEQGDVAALPAVQFVGQRSVFLRLLGARDVLFSSEGRQQQEATTNESDAAEQGLQMQPTGQNGGGGDQQKERKDRDEDEDEDNDGNSRPVESTTSTTYNVHTVSAQDYFPSYLELCSLEHSELSATIERLVQRWMDCEVDRGALRNLSLLLVYCLHLGHVLTVVGREHLRVVLWKYYICLRCCGDEVAAKSTNLTPIVEFYKMPRTFSIQEIYPQKRLHTDTTNSLYARRSC